MSVVRVMVQIIQWLRKEKKKIRGVTKIMCVCHHFSPRTCTSVAIRFKLLQYFTLLKLYPQDDHPGSGNADDIVVPAGRISEVQHSCQCRRIDFSNLKRSCPFEALAMSLTMLYVAAEPLSHRISCPFFTA